MQRDLKRYLLKHIDVKQFYTDTFDDFQPGQNVSCPFHSDDVPSMSIRNEDGAVYCHACGAKASSLIGFYEAYHKISYKEAMRRLWSLYISKCIPARRVSRWSRALQASPRLVDWIAQHRGVSQTTLQLLRIGWDGERITIPVSNSYGLWVNVRRYNSRRKPKILSFGKGYGEARLYPLEKYREDDNQVLLIEGEWDAILAWQMGYNVLTTTTGAITWKKKFSKLLAGKDIVICYDADDPGQKGAKKLAEILQKTAKTVRNIKLQLPPGQKDFTDYVVQQGKSARDFDKLIARCEITRGEAHVQQEEALREDAVIEVRIDEASKGDYFYRKILTNAHVTGKRLTPYLPPRRVSIRCGMDRGKLCTACHMLPSNGKKTIRFKDTDRRILGLIGSKDSSVRSTIRDIAKIPAPCTTKIETETTFNIEEITVTPPIDDAGGQYTSRLAYSIGHGLEANRSYRFGGYTVPHPADQSATHIFTAAKPLQTHLDSYEPTTEVLKRLERFRAKPGRLGERIRKIAQHQAEHVTKIIKRQAMHTAIDLVFHSPIQFYFNNEKVKKGYLEVAIIGDTRCGKGYVATELSRYYGVGEIATAENCSFAGLIGGITKHQNNYSISWGLIPRNNGRLVIIDETSGLDTRDIARMTRVRSEGIAEIFKIQAESTHARTRILWLSNTRPGRPVNTYAYGVESVPELFGKAEDVSKLDYALVVQSGDVDAAEINAARSLSVGESRYDQEDFQNLIMWIWSRKPHQIIFTEDATKLVLAESLRFGQTYHPSIPLVQVEDIRIKLARMAAAVAGRVFSTDRTKRHLLVTDECVAYGVRFLRHIYNRPPASYLAYSRAQYEATTIPNRHEVENLIEGLGEYKKSLVGGLLETKQLSITDVADFLDCDKYAAKEVIGKLVRAKCLYKDYTFYVKKPAFIKLLRRIR